MLRPWGREGVDSVVYEPHGMRVSVWFTVEAERKDASGLLVVQSAMDRPALQGSGVSTGNDTWKDAARAARSRCTISLVKLWCGIVRRSKELYWD